MLFRTIQAKITIEANVVMGHLLTNHNRNHENQTTIQKLNRSEAIE